MVKLLGMFKAISVSIHLVVNLSGYFFINSADFHQLFETGGRNTLNTPEMSQ